MPLRVLHVTESYGGGVLAAIRDYMGVTPWVKHHLLYAVRDDAPTDVGALVGFASVQELPHGHLAAIRAIRVRARLLQVNVVHAHSSFAGVYVRLALRAGRRSSRRPQIAYTPHCYAFEREDIGDTVRALYRFLEHVLAWNTDVFAACSPREAQLSQWSLSRAKVVHVPNVAPIKRIQIDRKTYSDKGRLRVTGAGRIRRGTCQKDPLWFLAAITATRAAGIEVDATWVGGGDPTIEEQLRNARIRVTGWLSREVALATVAESDVYLHTGAWEGFPIAVLEADALGVAQVLRSIAAFDGLDFRLRADQPGDVPELLSPLAKGRNRAAAVEHVRHVLAANTPADQFCALVDAWDFAEGS